MEQRVAVVLATVWLTSIVGASVPSGETTAFSTHHHSGPSPDQYTPLFRNPRYYSQDDYGQDWMNDEPSNFHDRKIVKKDEDVAVPYSFESKDVKTQSDSEKEAMRLSSMKVAFDEPIDSEQSSDTMSREDWPSESFEDDEAMQQDEFIPDDTFEDEGPGSVEVYKLDLYKDGPILNPKPSRKNWLKNKSKIPKKVEAGDQINWKRKDPEESKQPLPKTVSRIDYTHSDEMSPSKSLKDRIFGAGGVPELQVGCEGVEGSQRQKRSDSEEQTKRKSESELDESDGTSARATQLYIDPEYDSEEESEAIGGTDELFRILNEAKTTTDSSSVNENRGDMDPRVKTPGDLEIAKKKDKLPIRGDLGTSGDPNLTEAAEAQKNGTKEELLANNRRKLLSLEEKSDKEEGEELAENFRNKRSLAESPNGNSMNDGEKRGHRGHRSHHGHKEGKRRRRHEGRGERERLGNVIRKGNKAVDKNGEDYREKREEGIRENRLLSNGKRNEDHRRHREQQIEDEKRSEKERRTADENERKLEIYKRRNTPIPRKQRTEDHQPRWHPAQRDQLPTENSKNGPPQNIRLPVPPAHRNHNGKDDYADERRRLLEQIQGEAGHISRAAYQQELEKNQKEQHRQSTKRPQDQRQGKTVYKPRSQKEIDRLNALPVSAYIIINQLQPNNKGPKIEDRFGNDDKITFPGLTVENDGLKVPNFPSAPTKSPPVAGPSPCTWAVMTCCSSQNRLASCFEAKGCYHGHWDNPCSQDKILAALSMVNQHYKG